MPEAIDPQNRVRAVPDASLRVAVVGVGKVAVQNYLLALVKHDDVRLHYYNRSPEKAVAAATQCGGEAAPTLEALMAAQPDTVLVLTKETTRAEITEQFLVYSSCVSSPPGRAPR